MNVFLYFYGESNDDDISQTSTESEIEEELILSGDESDSELDDSIPSTSSNKRGVLCKFIRGTASIYFKKSAACYACCFFSHVRQNP